MEKTILSIIAIMLSVYVEWQYARAILQGKVKPHVFTWVIWGTTTLIIFFAQLSDGAGVGAWPVGIVAILTLLIAGLAYQKRGEITITRSDWVFFGIALLAIPLWQATNTALYTVIILTTIDLLGYLPTIRKSHHSPNSEPLKLFMIMNLSNLIVILALENYSTITLLFPIATASANFCLILYIIHRRKALGFPVFQK